MPMYLDAHLRVFLQAELSLQHLWRVKELEPCRLKARVDFPLHLDQRLRSRSIFVSHPLSPQDLVQSGQAGKSFPLKYLSDSL